MLFYRVDHLGGQRAYLPYRAGLGVGQIERRGKGIDQLRSIVGSAITSESSAEYSGRGYRQLTSTFPDL
jgi:hypothetical protein